MKTNNKTVNKMEITIISISTLAGDAVGNRNVDDNLDYVDDDMICLKLTQKNVNLKFELDYLKVCYY